MVVVTYNIVSGDTPSSQPGSTVIFLLCVGIILIVIAVLMYTFKRNNNDHHKGNQSYSQFATDQKLKNLTFVFIVICLFCNQALVQQKNFCGQKTQQVKYLMTAISSEI